MIAVEVKYKKTGNDFVPEIPEHWEILKAKNIGMFDGSTVDKKIDKHEKMIRLVNYMDIYDNETFEITDVVDFMKVTATEHQIKNLRVNIGDVVFTPSSEVREDIGKSAVIKYESEDLLFSYHVLRLRFNRELDINFKKYLFNNKPALKYFSKNCKGSTRKILNRIDFKNLPVYLPPIEEQKAIADYLDTQSAKITHFIQTKQRFIELLKEQRQSIITHAVTKGIDENVKMKETVLGEIPEHWELRRLKFCLNEKLKYGANASGDYYNPSWYRYIRITDFTADGTLDENNKLSLSPENGKDYELKDGDILLARSGATVGKSFQFLLVDRDERCCYAGYLIKASPNEEIILSDFLYIYTLSSNYENWKNSIFIKATIENISADKYANLLVTLPPVEEQKRILEHIKSETKTLDIAITKAEREIELIKEYREAMIAEAVTGKMKL
jgi:type I restriction enzyme S subunit